MAALTVHVMSTNGAERGDTGRHGRLTRVRVLPANPALADTGRYQPSRPVENQLF
jgi:hypothetical protein